MPGSSNDHLDNNSEATSVAVDVVSQASHDGSVRVISEVGSINEDDSISIRSDSSDGSCSGKAETGGVIQNENYPDSDSRSRSDRNRNPPSEPSIPPHAPERDIGNALAATRQSSLRYSLPETLAKRSAGKYPRQKKQ